MRSEYAFCLVAFLGVPLVGGQQIASSASSTAANSQITEPTVHYAASGVTAPELLPIEPPVSRPKHCDALDGVVTLSAIVGAEGVPKEVKTLQSENTDLASFASGYVASERFRPGTYDGAAASVEIELTIGLQTCVQRTKVAGGGEENTLKLSSHPVQSLHVRPAPPSTSSAVGDSESSGVYKVGPGVLAPVPLIEPEAEYSDYGRKKRIEGICLIGLVVDAQGDPQNVHIVKSLEPSMDEKALEAVRQMRFKPAMKDGTTPVPVEVTIEVNFRLSRKLF